MRWIQLMILLSAACILAGCNLNDGEGTVAAQAEATVTPIPTAPAAARPTYTMQRGAVEDSLDFTGRWLPRDQAQLSFEVAGTVGAVNVRRGDSVSAGTLLANLQITDLQNQLASAQLNLDSAIRRLNTTDTGESSVRSAQFALANSRLSLDSTVNSAPWTNLENARLSLENAQRSLDEAQRSYDDAISHADSAASQVDSAYQQLQNAQNSLRQAQVSYASAQQNFYTHQISVQQQENSVLQNELALQDAINGAGDNADLLEAVQSAQLNVDQIQANIQRSSLYAPIDGVVLEVTIQPGNSVQAFTTVITLALPQPMEAIANLAFNDSQQLSVGTIGVCQELGKPETAVQCIVRQLPLSSRDADQTARVAASLDNVALGQLIEVTMPLQVRENVLWLPPEAIRTFQNRTFVVLDTPDGQRVADVELGLQTDDRVEIVSGVNEGDVVVGP